MKVNVGPPDDVSLQSAERSGQRDQTRDQTFKVCDYTSLKYTGRHI